MVPALSVFQTPPDPTATNQRFSLLGSMAISAIRPDKNAGPIFLNSKASRKVSDLLAVDAGVFLRCAFTELANTKLIKSTDRILKSFIFLGIYKITPNKIV